MSLVNLVVEPVVAQTIYAGGTSAEEAYAAAHPESSVRFIVDYRKAIEKWTKLLPEAAHSFMRLQASWLGRGGTLLISDMLRTVDQQIELKKRKPTLAARPGTSLHGVGLAFDYDTMNLGKEPKTGQVYTWQDFDRHAQDHGWKILERAYREKGAPESWHCEFRAYPPAPFSNPHEILAFLTEGAMKAPKEQYEEAIFRVAKRMGYFGTVLKEATVLVQDLGRIAKDGILGPMTKQVVARLDVGYVEQTSTFSFKEPL